MRVWVSVWKVREHRVWLRVWQMRGYSEGTCADLGGERT